MMILPTIIQRGGVRPARRCRESYYEGSLALGATAERSVFRAMLPAARSGVILAGVVLGVGRAIGETMAVMMVAGNQPRMPSGILQRHPHHDGEHRHGNGLRRRICTGRR